MKKSNLSLKKQYTSISNDIIKSKILTPNEKLVHICLTTYANEDGICFPSIKEIASDCNMTKNTVITMIKGLEEKKFLIKELRYLENKGNATNMYKLFTSPYDEPTSNS